jgi:hypothetical protein
VSRLAFGDRFAGQDASIAARRYECFDRHHGPFLIVIMVV